MEKRSKVGFLYAHNEILCLVKKNKRSQYSIKKCVLFEEVWIHVPSVGVNRNQYVDPRIMIIGWTLRYHVVKFRDALVSKTWCAYMRHEIERCQKSYTQGANLAVKLSLHENYMSITKKIVLSKHYNVGDLMDDFLNKVPSTLHDKSLYELFVEYGKYQKLHRLIGIESPISFSIGHVKELMNLQLRSEKIPKKQMVDEEPALRTLNFVIKLRTKNRSKSFSAIDTAINYTPFSKSASSLISYWKVAVRKNETSKEISQRPLGCSKSSKFFCQTLENLSLNGFTLPEKLQHLMFEIYERGVLSDGIFRKSPNQREFKEAKRMLDYCTNLDVLPSLHPNICASLLKEFLRCLPESLVTKKLFLYWLNACQEKDTESMTSKVKSILSRTPYLRRMLLKDLMILLHHVTEYEHVNRMNATNLSICITPSLFNLCQTDSLANNKNSTNLAKITRLLVENVYEIFGYGSPTFLQSKTRCASPVPSNSNSSDDSSSSNYRLNAAGSLDSVFDDSSIAGSSVNFRGTPCSPSAPYTPATSRDSGLCNSHDLLDHPVLMDLHSRLEVDFHQAKRDVRALSTIADRPNDESKAMDDALPFLRFCNTSLLDLSNCYNRNSRRDVTVRGHGVFGTVRELLSPRSRAEDSSIETHAGTSVFHNYLSGKEHMLSGCQSDTCGLKRAVKCRRHSTSVAADFHGKNVAPDRPARPHGVDGAEVGVVRRGTVCPSSRAAPPLSVCHADSDPPRHDRRSTLVASQPSRAVKRCGSESVPSGERMLGCRRQSVRKSPFTRRLAMMPVSAAKRNQFRGRFKTDSEHLIATRTNSTPESHLNIASLDFGHSHLQSSFAAQNTFQPWQTIRCQSDRLSNDLDKNLSTTPATKANGDSCSDGRSQPDQVGRLTRSSYTYADIRKDFENLKISKNEASESKRIKFDKLQKLLINLTPHDESHI